MTNKIPYGDLPFLPSLIARTTCGTTYTGEWMRNISPAEIAETESARQAMTPTQILEFEEMCDRRCRCAYNTEAEWFMRCVRAAGNKGRDQLYMWTAHWLASYLKVKP